ncbi:MAG TPA: GGDEF domain-containing protein [bacterium]|jgi:diguanylate cyclase (GGDEF)-like protein|nr:GGDEF domain-containing protein [bacterium]
MTSLMLDAQANLQVFHPDHTGLRQDRLTGVGNLFAFLEDFAVALRRSPVLSVLLLDVDAFKQQVDAHGYATGDEMLQVLALFLGDIAEKAGFPRTAVYRFGGDTFCLLAEQTNPDDAARWAEQCVAGVRGHEFRLTDRSVQFTISVGVVGAALDAPKTAPVGVAGLLLQAFEALYVAKRHGGNTVRPVPSGWRCDARSADLTGTLVASILEALKLVQTAQVMAFTDPITGLPNQRAARAYLEQECLRAARHNHAFAVALVDGDNLRAYNDRFGYLAGNDMIRQLGEVLQSGVRESDFVARWLSGDEFLIIMPDATLETAQAAVERIRQDVASRSQIWALPVTISAGITAFPQFSENPDTLCHQAELANHLAKQRGRNRISVWEA